VEPSSTQATLGVCLVWVVMRPGQVPAMRAVSVVLQATDISEQLLQVL